MRCATPAGDATPESNRNGSARGIAGVLSPNLRVLGVMPHPENQVDPAIDGSDGLPLFESAAEAGAGQATAKRPAMLSNNGNPSVPSMAGSTWFSGCGITPSTRRFGDRTPAMPRALPLRFASGVASPRGVA